MVIKIPAAHRTAKIEMPGFVRSRRLEQKDRLTAAAEGRMRAAIEAG